MSGLSEMLQKYKGSTIAIYGLGVETSKVLEELAFCGGFQVVGLLDSFREDGALYGKRIISLEKCMEYQVKLILVVARPGSCRAISRKIGTFCMEHGIILIDTRGNNLCATRNETYSIKNMGGITKEQLRKQIFESDVISMDLFDTLVMRNVLSHEEVIELTENRIKEKGIIIRKFCEKRLQAEKELSQTNAPTLTEIYQFVLKRSEPVNISAEELAELEWAIDFGLIVPRQEMSGLLTEAYQQGKKAYVVTDTYYRKEQLLKLLKKCGIYSFTDVLASCEYGTGKSQNLFQKLKDIIRNQKCIHIGDDLKADVESAGQNGICAYRIFSGTDMLEKLGYLGLWESMDSLCSRIKIGMFTAKVFNSPFLAEKGEKTLCVRDAYDIGYLFMAPIITDFMAWFCQQIDDYGIKNIWFGARDGYLIKKLYDLQNTGSSSTYFLTSRMAAVRAGIEKVNDIDYVASMKYSGTLQQQLRERFGIEISVKETAGKTLKDFFEDIKAKAAVNRQNYAKYLKSLPVEAGSIAFFDFVAKGTTQMYVSRFLENHIKGLYFLQMERAYMQDKGLDISAFYGDRNGQNNAIYDDYYILETVMTSDMPSVLGFDADGEAVYAEETRDVKDIACIKRMQEGILDYFTIYHQIFCSTETEICRQTDEKLLNMIHKFKILDKDFLSLKVEDPFFNRMTDMVDLI